MFFRHLVWKMYRLQAMLTLPTKTGLRYFEHLPETHTDRSASDSYQNT